MTRINFIFLLLLIGYCNAQQPDPLLADNPLLQKKWVDSIYSVLRLDEKIGQLFIPIVFSKKDRNHFNEIKVY